MPISSLLQFLARILDARAHVIPIGSNHVQLKGQPRDSMDGAALQLGDDVSLKADEVRKIVMPIPSP